MIFILNAFQVSRKILTRVSQKNLALFHILSYFLWIYDICFMVMLHFFAVAIFDLISAYSVEITEVSFLIS